MTLPSEDAPPRRDRPHEVISDAESRFERRRQTIGLFVGPAIFLFILWYPFELDPTPHRLAAILAWVVAYWVTEAIPLPATALMGPLLCVLLGVTDLKSAFAPFAHPIIFLFIGSFIIAQAMTTHGLDRRVALALLSKPWVSRSPFRLMMVIGVFSALLSMWISNTAATAIIFPIVVGLLRGLAGREGTGSYATGVMLIVAYGASVGGIGTLIGTPPNLIGIGLIEEQAGVQISFVDWMGFGLPLVAVMLLVLIVLLYALHPLTGGLPAELRDRLCREREQLGPWQPGERNTAMAFGLAVTLWLMPAVLALTVGTQSPAAQWYKGHFPEAAVAVLAALLLFVLPVNWGERRFTVTWREASTIDWGTILLFGGGMSLGSQMFQTGLSNIIGTGLAVTFDVQSLWAITAFAIFLGIVMSELTSNTASATMIIPVVIAVALAADVSPIPPALGACLGASYGFMLPISTPPNAIVYGSGLIPVTRMMRAGILFDIAGFVVIWTGLRILCPLLGYV